MNKWSKQHCSAGGSLTAGTRLLAVDSVKTMEHEASHEAQNGDNILAQDGGDADYLNTWVTGMRHRTFPRSFRSQYIWSWEWKRVYATFLCVRTLCTWGPWSLLDLWNRQIQLLARKVHYEINISHSTGTGFAINSPERAWGDCGKEQLPFNRKKPLAEPDSGRVVFQAKFS